MCQPLPKMHPQDLLAKPHKQHQPVGTHQTRTNRGTAVKEKMELDRSYAKEKQYCNNQTGTNMEPTRQAEQRKTQKHLEKEHRARSEGTDLETAGEDGARQTGVESIHQWPMFRKE